MKHYGYSLVFCCCYYFLNACHFNSKPPTDDSSLFSALKLACIQHKASCIDHLKSQPFHMQDWHKRTQQLVQWKTQWERVQSSSHQKKYPTQSITKMIDLLQQGLQLFPEVQDVLLWQFFEWSFANQAVEDTLYYVKKLTQTLSASSVSTPLEETLWSWIALHDTQCTPALAAFRHTENSLSDLTFDPDSLLTQLNIVTHCPTDKLPTHHLIKSQLDALQQLVIDHTFEKQHLIHSKLSVTQQFDYMFYLEKNRKVHLALQWLDLMSRVHQKNKESVHDVNDRIDFHWARLSIQRVRKNYTEAIKKLTPILDRSYVDRVDVLLLLAKAHAKLKQIADMRTLYQTLHQEFPNHPSVLKAKFLDAFSYYETLQYKEAYQALAPLTRHQGKLKSARTLKGRSKNSWTAAAEWYYAWSLFLSLHTQTKKQSQMADFFIYQIGQGLPQSEAGRRAAYWAFIALQKHKPVQANTLKEQLIQGATQDWYALLLRSQFPQEIKDHTPWVKNTAQNLTFLQSLSHIQNHSQQSIHDLESMLQKQTATQVFRWQQKQMRSILKLPMNSKDTTSQMQQLQQMSQVDAWQWSNAMNTYYAGIKYALSKQSSLLRTAPGIDHQYWWFLAYPAGFVKETSLASTQHQIPQHYLWSFIRKESAFQAHVVSKAHALGLMQMLKKTAQSLIGLPQSPLSTDFNLFHPHDNIQLASFYLKKLSQRYHKQLPLMAAAYNAGPKALNSWIEQANQHGFKRLDYFVELIPFKEARNYVKRLQASACVYRLLYEKHSLNQCAQQLPWILSLDVGKGVNF